MTASAWVAADGTPLRADSRATLTDGERRWPVVSGIAWLRAGRDEVRERAVAALDDGDPDGAAVALLADADDWWDEPPPPPERLRAALHSRTLRDAVTLLGLGRVGVYFLHRWSDPSWLAALALTAAHPPAGRPVVDLACGAGHLLRHLASHGHRDLVGVDVVFAKLWLAHRFVLPAGAASLVCADLTAPWPLPPPERPRHVACHDALYFLPDKERVVERARAAAGDGGAVLLGHCHNAEHPAGRSGLPLDAPAWTALLPGSATYAEEELTAAAVEDRIPLPATPAELMGTEAVGLADDDAAVPPDRTLLRPAPGASLRPNPLYGDPGGPRGRIWPHVRWAEEYGPRAERYLPERWTPLPVADAVRRRLLLDLPDRW
ncbi:class I SAM-dependent methyltransferase [Pseudonocardia oceani]|uniref:class I SAM-dependent methyltransferase n=1 Tax=Pseudonocardia oceani TaxID=2792013 RepID=UPI001C4A413B|nr:class I SAM-dependent methyltransferase [Pseudonocardia oceani]